jgi:hypothetical protein
MARKPPPQETERGTVLIELECKSYSGDYVVRGDYISVTCSHGSRDASVLGTPGRTPQDGFAGILLSEIIREAKQNGRLRE